MSINAWINFVLYATLGKMGGVKQIAWALRTQQEVITLPCEIEPHPVIPISQHEFDAIEARLAPPWLADNALPNEQVI